MKIDFQPLSSTTRKVAYTWPCYHQEIRESEYRGRAPARICDFTFMSDVLYQTDMLNVIAKASRFVFRRKVNFCANAVNANVWSETSISRVATTVQYFQDLHSLDFVPS